MLEAPLFLSMFQAHSLKTRPFEFAFSAIGSIDSTIRSNIKSKPHSFMDWLVSITYRLKGCCPLVAIPSLARACGLSSSGNVGIVGLFAVGHCDVGRLFNSKEYVFVMKSDEDEIGLPGC